MVDICRDPHLGRIAEGAGEKQIIRFEVAVSELGFTGRDMSYTVEPGDFKVWIGPDAASGLEGDFMVR